MKKALQISWFFLSLGCIMSSGCKKTDIADDTPVIAFKSANESLNDTGGHVLKLVFTVKDGDGDIGNDTVQTQVPPGSPLNDDLVVRYYEYINGRYTELTPHYPFAIGDTIRFYGHLPYLTPAGKYKSIKGDIQYTIDLNGAPVKSNQIKMRFWIYDRAMHKSNEIETPDIVI